LNPFLNSLSRSPAMAHVASLWSPAELNPLKLDPFRELLEAHIDFKLVREKSPVELLIAATAVATGATRLFRRHEMTVQAVLASACLPTLHHTVEIDGVAYWDGGFSANPDLVNLALESPVRDTLIVQLSPASKYTVPRQARDIGEHVNRLTFSAPLLRDVQLIESVRETAIGIWYVGGGRLKPLALHRFHLIDAGRYTATLAPETRIKPDAGVLAYLHGAGRTEAARWLERHKRDIGKWETVDLTARYLRPAAERESARPNAAEPTELTPRKAGGG
jgi:NTE family protein